MRKIAFAILATLLLGVADLMPGAPAAIQAANAPKVVIIVGPVAGSTDYYKGDGDKAATEALKYTPNVVKVYTPTATWAAAQAALQGASLVIYMGHGNGFPSPYFSGPDLYPPYGYLGYPQDRVDGLGLNPTATATDNTTVAYYGELSLRNGVRLAPGAVVLLNHLCYSAGQSEPNKTPPSLTVARARVDNMAAGWIAAGAQAVVGEPYNSPAWYVTQLFTATTTVEAIWRAQPNRWNNVSTFTSVRSPGFQPLMDTTQPVPSDPSTVVDIYRRSLVTSPGFRFLAPQFTPPSTPTTFVPIPPTRVLDSRVGLGVGASFRSGIPQSFPVGGLRGVPAGATAIAGNLTVTGPSRGGYLALTPTPTAYPTTSTLNFPAVDTRANGVIAPLGPGGSLAVVYISGRLGDRADALLDVTGYFLPGTTGARYVPLDPGRVLDTRDAGKAPLDSGKPLSFPVVGLAGVPVDAVAVTGNVTVVGQERAGYVALTPAATEKPTTSTINFPAGDVRANGITVPLGADGTLSATYVTGLTGDTTELVFDVTGYFTLGGTGGTYVPVAPARILDTRTQLGAPPLASASPATFQVAGAAGIPAAAKGVTGNVTVVGQTAPGYVAVTTLATPSPTTSTINFPKGDIRANAVTARLAPTGALSATYVTGRPGDATQLVFDVTGYFA